MAINYKPHNYQKTAIDHILYNERSGLFLGLGLGKTSTTLTAIVELFNRFEISKVLIIAPKLVTQQTWPAEIKKWEHTKHLKVSVIAGTPFQRMRALKTPADIYTISRDNITWLIKDALGRGGWDFDMLVIDELSSFKNHASQRFKALKKVSYLSQRCVGLTGTPAPNSLMDLWSQIYLLDQGHRLGKNITQYRDAYFTKNYNEFGYAIRSNVSEHIHKRIGDICISMTAKDYLDMPDRTDNVQYFDLKNHEKYDEFKTKEVLRLEEAGDITPVNAAALYSKLLQFSNGAVYDADKVVHLVDETKLDMLEETVEAMQGEPLLVFYQFQSDRARILKRIKSAVAYDSKIGEEQIDAWNRREIPVFLANPASIGHGINMQFGGHNILWFGLPWSLELYEQSVGRIDRQGQTKKVVNTMLVAKGTVEEIVLQRLGDKTATQNDLIDALKKHLF